MCHWCPRVETRGWGSSGAGRRTAVADGVASCVLLWRSAATWQRGAARGAVCASAAAPSAGYCLPHRPCQHAKGLLPTLNASRSALASHAAEHRHLRLHLLLVLGLIVLVSFEWLLLRGILVVRFVEQRLDAHQQVLDGERGLPTLRWGEVAMQGWWADERATGASRGCMRTLSGSSSERQIFPDGYTFGWKSGLPVDPTSLNLQMGGLFG